MADDPLLDTPLARHVWETRYRVHAAEASIEASWRRVARALAGTETTGRGRVEQAFLDILHDFQFLPGGRILAGAGSGRDVTLLNCFVMGPIEDSIPGIFRALKEGARTMQRGGGIGCDFSSIRPKGTPAQHSGAVASGPVSFMDVWDAMCATIQSSGARRGAMMATLRCDHPDVVDFIEAKRQPARLQHFNLSVLVTDAFMRAVDKGEAWPLTFPQPDGARGAIRRIVPAREVWDRLMHASYDTGEPGVLFIDRINRLNNLASCEHITATNPCGEVPLPAYGACDLGSINLTRLIRSPFSPQAQLDGERLVHIVSIAVRMLDNVIDATRAPLKQQRAAIQATRRIGLGITGLADSLTMLGLRYGDDASRAFAAATMRTIRHAAYRQSVTLAKEKGCFPLFDKQCYLDAPFIRSLPDDIRDDIAAQGIRNSHLLAIAPTGTISLLAGNVSSGIEPAFAADYRRTVLDAAGKPGEFKVTDYAVQQWRKQCGRPDGAPAAFSAAMEVSVAEQVAMQAVLQRYVDNAISKTISVPPDVGFSQFSTVFKLAYDSGLKGCAAFRVADRSTLIPVRGLLPSSACGTTCQ